MKSNKKDLNDYFKYLRLYYKELIIKKKKEKEKNKNNKKKMKMMMIIMF